MEERTYTLKEFLEAELDASVSVKWAAAGRSDEQTAKDIAMLRAKLAEDSLLIDPSYIEEDHRRTWNEWIAYIADGDDILDDARERGIDEG